MNVSHLTNEELVRVVDNRVDTTPLEDELASRLDAALEVIKGADAALDVLENYDLDPMKTSDIERIDAALKLQQDFPRALEMLEALMNLDIDTAAGLTTYLESLSQPETQE